MHLYRQYMKRLMDVIIAAVILISIWWLILLVILVYLFFLKGAVFFKHERIGQQGRFFWLYKFRTLSPDVSLPLLQRQFWFGKLLRKFSLDELPQLYNVLKGDMSLVGPRPLPVEYAPLFSKQQNKRHEVRPGITGLAQVNGRNSIPWKLKLEYDQQYVNELSLWLDQKILLKTIVLIFSFKEDVSLHEAQFTGKE